MFNTKFQDILNTVDHGLYHGRVRKHGALRNGSQLRDRQIAALLEFLVAHAQRLMLTESPRPADVLTAGTELKACGSVVATSVHACMTVAHGGHKRVGYHTALAQYRDPDAFFNLFVAEQVYRDRYTVRVDIGPEVFPAGTCGTHALVQVALFNAVPGPDHGATFRAACRSCAV